MRKSLAAVLVTTVAAAFIGGDEAIDKFYQAEAPALNIDVQVKPIEHDAIQLLERPWPGKYRASVIVEADPGSRVMINTEDIIISPGETKESRREHKDLVLTFVVELGQGAAFAKTSVALTRDGKIIGRQLATVWLAQPKRVIVPAEPAP